MGTIDNIKAKVKAILKDVLGNKDKPAAATTTDAANTETTAAAAPEAAAAPDGA